MLQEEIITAKEGTTVEKIDSETSSSIGIEIGNKKYTVNLAKTEKEKEKGLMHKQSLPTDEGMLFIYDKPQTVGFWMKDTSIPLDIIFIDEDCEVISIYKAKPLDETIVEEDNVKYVLEVNQNSGIKEGDELEYDEDPDEDLPTMKVIGSNGETQMELEGGERIFSRKNTRTLIRMAKRAEESNSDTDYKKLGRKIFKYIEIQDNRDPEYVELKTDTDK